jgi:hypothetical protein
MDEAGAQHRDLPMEDAAALTASMRLLYSCTHWTLKRAVDSGGWRTDVPWQGAPERRTRTHDSGCQHNSVRGLSWRDELGQERRTHLILSLRLSAALTGQTFTYGVAPVL